VSKRQRMEAATIGDFLVLVWCGVGRWQRSCWRHANGFQALMHSVIVCLANRTRTDYQRFGVAMGRKETPSMQRRETDVIWPSSRPVPSQGLNAKSGSLRRNLGALSYRVILITGFQGCAHG
jgi:hypothetical protein